MVGLNQKRPNVLLCAIPCADEPLCCCTGSDNESATLEESKGEGVTDGAV